VYKNHNLTLKARRTDIDGTKLCPLALDMAPHTGKIIKNHLVVFERGENLLQNSYIVTLCILDPVNENRLLSTLTLSLPEKANFSKIQNIQALE